MLNRDFDLTATIRSTSAALQDAIARTEAAAVDAVSRTASALPNIQGSLDKTRRVGGVLVSGLDEAGRATVSGVTEIAGKLAEHGRLAIADTVELLRATASPANLSELVAAHAGYAGRRGLAMFQIVDELNAVSRTHTLAALRPVTEAIEGLARPVAGVAAAQPRTKAETRDAGSVTTVRSKKTAGRKTL